MLITTRKGFTCIWSMVDLRIKSNRSISPSALWPLFNILTKSPPPPITPPDHQHKINKQNLYPLQSTCEHYISHLAPFKHFHNAHSFSTDVTLGWLSQPIILFLRNADTSPTFPLGTFVVAFATALFVPRNRLIAHKISQGLHTKQTYGAPYRTFHSHANPDAQESAHTSSQR